MTGLLSILREVLSAGALLAPFLMIALDWTILPDQVPIHFGWNGQPDGWASKGNLFFLPSVSLLSFFLLASLCQFPNLFNYPVEMTETNEPRQKELILRLLNWIRLEVTLLFMLLTWETLQVAKKAALGLSPWLLPITLGAILLTVLFYLYSAKRNA